MRLFKELFKTSAVVTVYIFYTEPHFQKNLNYRFNTKKCRILVATITRNNQNIIVLQTVLTEQLFVLQGQTIIIFLCPCPFEQ